MIGTSEGIFRCRTIMRKAEEISYDASCFDFLKMTYDEYIVKDAKTTQHVLMPIGDGQAPIPMRGRDFVPRRL